MDPERRLRPGDEDLQSLSENDLVEVPKCLDWSIL